MKTLLLLLLTCLPLCAATTYPLLSTTTNRTVTGGVTNMSLLNANQTFTGTNTFPAASFYTANNIGRRLLFTTNIFIPTIAVVASDKTNNGDYANVTQLFKVTLPALLSSNSMVVLSLVSVRTNANAVAAIASTFVGSATNWLSSGAYGASTTVGKLISADSTVLLANWISFTNQIQGGSTVLINTPTNFVDTSISWDLMLGFYVLTTAYTNYWATYSYYEIIGQ